MNKQIGQLVPIKIHVETIFLQQFQSFHIHTSLASFVDANSPNNKSLRTSGFRGGVCGWLGLRDLKTTTKSGTNFFLSYSSTKTQALSFPTRFATHFKPKYI